MLPTNRTCPLDGLLPIVKSPLCSWYNCGICPFGAAPSIVSGDDGDDYG